MNNLAIYHKVLKQLEMWLPKERVTRKRNLALMVLGLQQSGSVHLAKIVRHWPVPSQLPSLVNRLNRFLNNPHISPWHWYRPLVEVLLRNVVAQEARLIMDCTKVGNHRMLTVSLAYKRRCLPLIWRVYPGSKGHVAADEQLALLKELAPFLTGTPVCLLADAGFESVRLLRWLTQQGWHFVIRQNGRTKLRLQDAQSWFKLNTLTIHPGQTRTLGWIHLTERHQAAGFYLVVYWQAGEAEPWYLLSNFERPAQRLIRLYRYRMWTEELYGDLKGHGFDLEATRLTDALRISRLMLAVAITYVWLISLGSWVVKRGLRHLLDVKSLRDKSYFRIGWDWLQRTLSLQLPIRISFCPYP